MQRAGFLASPAILASRGDALCPSKVRLLEIVAALRPHRHPPISLATDCNTVHSFSTCTHGGAKKTTRKNRKGGSSKMGWSQKQLRIDDSLGAENGTVSKKSNPERRMAAGRTGSGEALGRRASPLKGRWRRKCIDDDVRRLPPLHYRSIAQGIGYKARCFTQARLLRNFHA